MATHRPLVLAALTLLLASACARPELPPELRKALSDKGLSLELRGNSTFRGLMATVKNESEEAKNLILPAGLLFTRPEKEGLGDMLLVRDEAFALEPGTSDIRLLEAFSLSYGKGIPSTEVLYSPSDLHVSDDPEIQSFIAWLGTEEGKELLDPASPEAERNGQRVQSVLWFATEGLTQDVHVGESVDLGILNEIYNATDLGTLLALFTEEERAGLDIQDQGAVVEFVIQNLDDLAQDRAQLHRRMLDAFGDSGYAEVKKQFLSGFQESIDEERVAVQDILDKAGIEGSY